MGAADLRDVVVTRQRELASRHDVLGRAGRDPSRYEDLLLRVFDATNDLMRDLDRMRARSARRRRLLAAVLAAVSVVAGVLVATDRLRPFWLIPAVAVLALAITVWAVTGADSHRRGRARRGPATPATTSAPAAPGAPGAPAAPDVPGRDGEAPAATRARPGPPQLAASGPRRHDSEAGA